MDMDWREILRFSQKELKQSDKDNLCESLSWMEVDDIELNFTDLKILFKLAQDILKYKNEQVNSALDKLDKTKRKVKTKERSTLTESPAMSSDGVLVTIEHQEEVIKANKDILEQLYADIAELEGRKSKVDKSKDKSIDQDSASSRATLSEMNIIVTLENEVTKKNRHIRKLLSDVKLVEEENATLKEKLMIFKNKLKESTLLIENLTEQLFTLNKENTNAKDFLGKAEQEKANLLVEIENLQTEVNNKHHKTEQTEEDIKTKLQHFKNLLKTQKNEIERYIDENAQLKKELQQISKTVESPKKRNKKQEESRNAELQEKLTEASEQMLHSAKIIQTLKDENKRLKAVIDVPEHSVCEQKNESDDGKERHIINKLKRKITSLNVALQGSEEMLTDREKQITEIAAQLQLLRSDEGINALIESIKNKKKHLRLKDEGIKSLVCEVNDLNEIINELQLENETMREKLGLPANEKINSHGFLKKYRDLENGNIELIRKLQECENRLITVELDNRDKKAKILKYKATLKTQTVDKTGEYKCKDEISSNVKSDRDQTDLDTKTLLEENEGLRNGLTEVFNFLKENRTTAGVLLLECPSLEKLLNSMEARKAAGWFSPHMKTVMELKAALGGKDALLSALNESRHETFDVLNKLALEKQKSSDLEKRLQENVEKQKVEPPSTVDLNKFGCWMATDGYKKIDVNDKNQVTEIINAGNMMFDNDFKQALQYFQEKFSVLFEKFTSLTISASDDFNKWTIQEEQYKAEIVNLKSQIEDHDDDSNLSPGLLTVPNSNIDRKCSFLEDLYKQIRTEKENIKNEYYEAKRERMTENWEYERKVQRLLIAVLTLSDQLRSCIPLEMFYKQSEDLNKYIIKYRNILEINGKRHIESEDLVRRLDEIKIDILDRLHQEPCQKGHSEKILEVEQSILQEQLRKICLELADKDKKIEKLEKTILDLQLAHSELTDKTLSFNCKEDNFYKNEFIKSNEENKMIKEQYEDTKIKLNKTYLQLQNYQQKELANDIELNMLRHQIIDLQSLGDNKAIIARLSGEILVAQLQVTESYDKIEMLKIALNKEKQLRAETEDILMSRQKVFDIYSTRFDNKIRVISEVMGTLRQQYQGNIPLASVESFINKLEEIQRKSTEVNEKLNDIEDLQSSLMTKHSLYNNILDHSKTKCLDNDNCPHKLKYLITEKTQKLEAEYCKKKLLSVEEAYKTFKDRCDDLEKTLILVNQGFKVFEVRTKNEDSDKQNGMDLKVENIHSEDEMSSLSSGSRKSRTFTLSPPKAILEKKSTANETVQSSLEPKKAANQETQTPQSTKIGFIKNIVKFTQTDDDEVINELKTKLNNLITKEIRKDKIIEEINNITKQREHDLIYINNKNVELAKANQILTNINTQKDEIIRNLQTTDELLRKEMADLKLTQKAQINKMKEAVNADNQSVMDTLKRIEIDKNKLIAEYKELLQKERQDYSNSVNELQMKIRDLEAQLDQKDTNVTNSDVKEVTKYHLKVRELETENFKLQSDFESSQADLINQQGELERWKNLASERLTKMELLSTQLKERHGHEMESYKAENQHWLLQLKETQREHMELRNRLTEQKTLHLRQIAEKDSLVEKLRSVINNLKSQILNMQTMLTINDPSFDLSAIVEMDERSETISLQGSDRLELKFESTVDFTEMEDDVVKVPSSSTAIWQEPQIERLRREKQLMLKQNTSLRRQVKILAARERRARLDSQNLKSQVFRISASASKAPPVEARVSRTRPGGAAREQAAALALWDKMKRAQQTSERWQVRYEEKCQEANKLEISLNLTKSAVVRLEKEKRALLARLSEAKNDRNLSIEKQECETPEKALVPQQQQPSPLAAGRALAARVEAQQRRIVALELAGQGNDTLVSEYERALAQITCLKGQVLKLESTLLETQIRSPLTHTDVKPEVDYWKNYCDMLKEENLQLTMKINTLDNVTTSSQHQKVNDLEQTVLTLRGLVSKLQVEKSSNTNVRKYESRPSSSRAGPDKVQSYRIEITNLKRSIIEKDALLEKSKEMLQVAAEREDYLLRENSQLRRRVEQLTEMNGGFLSA